MSCFVIVGMVWELTMRNGVYRGDWNEKWR